MYTLEFLPANVYYTKKKLPSICRILHCLKFKVAHICNSNVIDKRMELKLMKTHLIFMW